MYKDLLFDGYLDECEPIYTAGHLDMYHEDPRERIGPYVAKQLMATLHCSKGNDDHELMYQLPQPVNFVYEIHMYEDFRPSRKYDNVHQIVKNTIGHAEKEGLKSVVIQCDEGQDLLRKALEEEHFQLVSEGSPQIFTYIV